MLRFGLCCQFRDQPIKFRTTTATSLARMSRADALAKVSRLCLDNAAALQAALEFCATHGIGSFRILSQILPVKTHPDVGYDIAELPDADVIVRRFRECGAFAATHGLRTGFHPDQFVVLNSPRAELVAASIRELDAQAEVAEWVGADTLNLHGGGAYGDKPRALADFQRALDRLPLRVRERLTVENDDKIYTPADLLPVCRASGVPLVYDVHHHRCHGDGLSVGEATAAALETWNREPLFHISSPRDGWSGPQPERHHDFLDPADFPAEWLGRNLTVEIEAKAKEAAVLQLMYDLTFPQKRRPSPARR
jgi:UV DNA damage endonuclease